MNNVDAKINNISLSSLGVIIQKKEIGEAKANSKYIEIAGRNGKLDVTDFLGQTYQNRTITLKCCIIATNETEIRKSLENQFNGVKCSIIFTDDLTKAWQGRVQIGKFTRTSFNVFEFTITADVEPIAREVI